MAARQGKVVNATKGKGRHTGRHSRRKLAIKCPSGTHGASNPLGWGNRGSPRHKTGAGGKVGQGAGRYPSPESSK